jgi:group I intron endonuclease
MKEFNFVNNYVNSSQNNQYNIGRRYYSTFNNIEENLEIFIENSNNILLDKNNIFIKNLKYVYCYEDMLKDKLNIINNHKNEKGIYLLFNKCTNKYYIGSSKNLSSRLHNYYFLSRLLDNRYISKSINKYGHNNFSLFILEIVEDNNFILNREQYYIDLYKPIYNILQKAGNSLGYKHTELSKLKISISNKGKKVSPETREFLSNLFKGENNPMYGKKHTEEVKQKLRESRKGENNPMYSKPKSAEFMYYMTRDKSGENNPMYGKSKSAETLKKIRKCIYVYDENSKQLIHIYESFMEAIKDLKIGKDTLRKYALSNKPFKGKIFSYNKLNF